MSEPVFVAVFFAVALAWRLIPAWEINRFVWDEVGYGLPTLHLIQNGYLPLHYLGASYMVPVDEYIGAFLFHFTGPSPVVLRLGGITLASVGWYLAYRSFRRWLPLDEARAVSLLLAAPSSMHVVYVSVAASHGYGTFCMVAAWLLLQRLHVTDRMGRYACYGAILGVINFIFPQSRIHILAFLCIVFGPHLWRRIIRSAQTKPGKASVLLLTISVGSAAPVFYRYLTRRESYTASSLELALIGFALVAGAIAAWHLFWTPFWRASSRKLVAFFALAILTSGLPEQYYQRYQKGVLEPHGAHDAATYHLRHAHEWPGQILFFVGKIIPRTLIGEASTYSYARPENYRPGPSVAVGLALIILWTIACYQIATEPSRQPARTQFAWLVVPLILLCTSLIPSWNLANEFNARYLSMVLPGVIFPFVYLMRRHLPPALGGTALLVLLIWNGHDALISWPRFLGF
jgi:hypothetical protein